MCSPELTKGMCAICLGTVTPDNAFGNEMGLWEDLHRGFCAILAGIMPEEHLEKSDNMIRRIHATVHGPARIVRTNEYYAWARSIAEEDHYDMGGPQ